MIGWLSRIDMMVRLLVLAILLATFAPVTGSGQLAAQYVSNAAIFLLFFLNGIRLSRKDVRAGIGNLRFLAPLTFWCFGAMAAAGYGMFLIAGNVMPALVALGLIYLGAMPSTVQSAAAYTSVAEGNVAASVVSAALLNILGVFVSIPIFAWLSGGEAVELGSGGLFKIFMILLLPFALGQLSQNRLGNWLKANPLIVSWMDRLAIAIAVYVAFSGAVEQDLWTMLDLAAWGYLIAAIAGLLLFAFAGAWALSGVLALGQGDRISFMFAGAHKSVAMGAPLAVVIFGAEKAGLILVPLLVYHLLQLVVSAPLATRLAQRQDLQG